MDSAKLRFPTAPPHASPQGIITISLKRIKFRVPPLPRDFLPHSSPTGSISTNICLFTSEDKPMIY
jgi:hypothetical protein